ncbi:MAG: J domain-containing protein, partial [Promethearchaeia archaeon]
MKAAFRRLAFDLHPDRARASRKASQDGFLDLQQAFDQIMTHRRNRRIAHRLAAGDASVTAQNRPHSQTMHRPASQPSGATASAVLRPGVAASLIGSCCLLSAGVYLGFLKYRMTKSVI